MKRILLFPIASLLVVPGACSHGGEPFGSGAIGSAAGSASNLATGVSGATTTAGTTSSGGALDATGSRNASGTTAGGSLSGGAGELNGAAAGNDAVGVLTPSLPTLVTSGPDAYWKTDGQLTEVSSDTVDVSIDESAVAQIWQGFGGTFSERGGDYLSALSVSDRDTALRLLFSEQGLRFRYGRIPIGASDYAIDRYSLNETAGDNAMTHFSIDRDKQKLLPYIQAALAVAPQLHLWASPWSPPTWMKSNKAFDGGNLNEDDATLQALSLYLTKFVQEYGKQGVPIEAVHPQKEPNLALDFPSCVWSAAAMTKFIGSYLGPMFSEQKVGAQIFLGSLSEDDHTGKALAIIEAVSSDTGAMSYVKGFGFEWDGLALVAGVRAKNLPIWQDNHNVGNLPWGTPFNPTAAPNDHAYAVTSWGFIRDWIRAGVSAYFTSNMILDSAGVGIGAKAWPQNALLVVDSAKKLVVTPAFYVFRHISPFVDSGATVIGTSGGDALAFRNPDGTLVAVLFNSGAARKTVVAIGGKKLQFDMPGNGWATVKAN